MGKIANKMMEFNFPPGDFERLVEVCVCVCMSFGGSGGVVAIVYGCWVCVLGVI